MELLGYLLDRLNDIPPEYLSLAGITLGNAVVGSWGSSVTKNIINYFKHDKLASKYVSLLVIAFMLIIASLAYLFTTPLFAPWFIVAQAGVAFLASQPIYHFLFKPFYGVIIAKLQSMISKTLADAEARSAAIPDGGLPYSQR